MLLLKKYIRPQKGQILILSVVILPLLLMITILIIEVGNVYIRQSELQDAADTAVIAFANNKQPATVANLINLNINELEDSDLTIYTSQNNNRFYVKLEETIKPIFFKLSEDLTLPKLKIYSAASEDKKLILLPQTEPTWTKYQP